MITVLLKYQTWVDAGHYMLPDRLETISKIVEVEKLTDVNTMFNTIVDVKVLTPDTQALTPEAVEFIEYIFSSQWYYEKGYWSKHGYRTRTTQELFQYYLKCKERGQGGC